MGAMEFSWLWLAIVVSLAVISSTDGATCNRTRTINIAVVYYDDVYTAEDWPANFPQRRFERSETVPIEAKGGACYILKTTLRHILLANISFVFSEPELHSIRQFDILMGPFSRIVENLALAEKKLYLITSPVDLSFEDRVTGSRDTRFLFPIWPLWSDFLKLMKDYISHIRLEEKVTRIHIVYGGTSENIIYAAQNLHSMLSEGALFDYVGLSYFMRYDPREPLKQERSNIQGLVNPVMQEAWLISDVIENREADLVIGCFDLEDLTPIMKLFGDKQVDLDRSNLKWFIANMLYTSSWERFSDLGFDYSAVRAASYSRAKFGRGVNRLAAEDTLKALTVALESLDNQDNLTSATIGNAMGQVNITDVMIGGKMEFDENNYRTGYLVTVRNMCESLVCSRPQGTWVSQGRDNPGQYRHIGTHITEATKVVAVLEHPFVNTKKDRLSRLKGNERYEGILVDILQEVAIILLRQGKRFDYEIYEVPDHKYGVRHPNGTWDGAFREIKDNRATLAVGMISKTKERMTEFQFSPGFAFTGITFIVHKQELKNVYFQFLRPFEMRIWGGIVAAWLFSSLLIYTFHRWDPFKDNLPLKKKKKQEPVDEDAPNYTDDRFARDERYNLKESFWYSYLTLAQLGTPFAAYSYPIRIYSVFYWFFALIVVACYTGNLASFLTESIFFHPHLTIKELLKEGYDFGWMKSTSIEKFFVDSPIWEYQEMNRELRRRKTYAASYKHGLAMIKENTNFVFIATHLLLSYYEGMDENCTLHVSQERLDMTELAFPMRSDWALLEEFNAAMMELREAGHIRSIFNNFFAVVRLILDRRTSA
ncbi:glutamate receptor 3-like isoform X2 [Lineus longissimus]|uniref:glutamate receptor 3-like isoform X2 n=1 Tax=Lineus longissimus TaxID=88925 RepID=UPI00315D2281